MRSVLTASLSSGATTGVNFTALGPDISNVQDLTSDAASFNAGRQLVMIVSTGGTEICYLESITPVSGSTYTLGTLVRAQYGTTDVTHPSGAKVYIFALEDVAQLQDQMKQFQAAQDQPRSSNHRDRLSMLECPECSSRLSVKRTYSAGGAGQTQETICPGCGKRFAAVTIVLRGFDRWGLGAFAAATQLRAGLLKLVLDKLKV